MGGPWTAEEYRRQEEAMPARNAFSLLASLALVLAAAVQTHDFALMPEGFQAKG